MRLEEVSELTGVPLNTLRFYRATGKGPKMWKLAGRVVAYRDDVLEWLDAQYLADQKEAV